MRNTPFLFTERLAAWQGGAEYVIRLRDALDASGFGNVGITLEADWQNSIKHAPHNARYVAQKRAPK